MLLNEAEPPPEGMTPDQLKRAADAVTGPDGLVLLRYLRKVYYRDSEASTTGPAADAAADLGWITRDGNGPSLTEAGGRIADCAREYCNWLEDGRGLPVFLANSDVAGKRVLDIGCSFGRYLFALERAGADAVGLEPSAAYAQLSRVFAAREGLKPPRIELGGAEALPFEDESFDVIIFNRSLEYTNIPRALAEAGRVTAPGGRCFILSCSISHTFTRLRRGRSVKRHAAILLNSIAFTATGKHLIRNRPGETTRASIRVTTPYLKRRLDASGLELKQHDRDLDLFVADRR